jgi:hypothetical protein
MLIRYFMAEKCEALIFIFIGIAAIAAALYLIKTASSYKAMSYPLVFIALIQMVAGGTVFFRTDHQVEALQVQMTNNIQQFKAGESVRMAKVINGFGLYEKIEIFLIAIGIAFMVVTRCSAFWRPVGIGLVIQSSVTLILDLIAEKRALEYMQFLRQLLP